MVSLFFYTTLLTGCRRKISTAVGVARPMANEGPLLCAPQRVFNKKVHYSSYGMRTAFIVIGHMNAALQYCGTCGHARLFQIINLLYVWEESTHENIYGKE